MIRVAMNRMVYLIIVTLLFFAIIKGYWVIAVVLPVAGVVAEKILWRNFYMGKRLMAKQRDKSAVEAFRIFMGDLEEKPWIRHLQIFNFGIYTHNMEAKVYNNIGICYLESQVLKTAEEYFKRSLEEDEKYCLPHYNLAILNLIRKDEEESKKHLELSRKYGYNRIQFDQLKGYVHVKYHMDPSDLLRQ